MVRTFDSASRFIHFVIVRSRGNIRPISSLLDHNNLLSLGCRASRPNGRPAQAPTSMISRANLAPNKPRPKKGTPSCLMGRHAGDCNRSVTPLPTAALSDSGPIGLKTLTPPVCDVPTKPRGTGPSCRRRWAAALERHRSPPIEIIPSSDIKPKRLHIRPVRTCSARNASAMAER